MTVGARSFRERQGPSNNELQRTRHGHDGASPLNSVFDRRDTDGRSRTPDDRWSRGDGRVLRRAYGSGRRIDELTGHGPWAQA
jgi:hypothetical protein